MLLVESTIFAIATLEHTFCVAGVATANGSAPTITVAVIGVPTQPAAVGVMVNITVCDVPVMLTSVPAMSPEPEAAIPVTLVVLSLDHA